MLLKKRRILQLLFKAIGRGIANIVQNAMFALGTAAVTARLLDQIGPSADPASVTLFGVLALITAVIIYVANPVFQEKNDVDSRMHTVSDLRSHFLLGRLGRKRRVHRHRPAFGQDRKKI